MSREQRTHARTTPRRSAPSPVRLVIAILPVTAAAVGCGRDAGTVARAAADSVWHAPGVQAGSGAAVAPTPGFTSAQGTPPAAGRPTTSAAAAMAPPPSVALDRQLGADERAAIADLPAGAGHDLVLGNCLICHAATMITQQHKDTAGWNKTVTQMIAWGAPVPQGQHAALVAYLAEHYRARTAGPPARQVP